MVAENQVLSLRSLLEFPGPLFAAVDRLFPGVDPETRERAKLSREVSELRDQINAHVLNTPSGEDTDVLDVAFETEAALEQWVMYCFAEFAKANSLEIWKDLKQEAITTVYTNIIGMLLVYSQKQVEDRWLETQNARLKSSYERFLQEHPSFDAHLEPEIRIVHKHDEMLSAIGDLIERFSQASEGHDFDGPGYLRRVFADARNQDR